MKGCCLLLCVFLVQLALGDHSDIYYWKPNSNWKNPSNWELGKPPCGNQIASIPDNTVIYLNEDASVQTLMLPENGQVILGANIALTLSDDGSTCEDDGPGQTDAGDTRLMNGFIGNTAHYWECSENWLTSDGFPAKHPPCGEDMVVFEEDSYFHYVVSNETIRLSSLKVREEQITSSTQLDSDEFRLDLTIVPGCADDSSLCPCPSSAGCPSLPGIPGAVTSNSGMVSGIVVGVLLAVILLVAVAVILVVAFIMYRKRTTVGLYQKDDLLDHDEQPEGKEETTTSNPAPVFDNPIYNTTVAPSGLADSPGKPKLDFQPQEDASATPSGIYEAVGEVELRPGEENFVKVDLGALEVTLDTTKPTGQYETMEDNSDEFFEEETKKGKKKHGKYERF